MTIGLRSGRRRPTHTHTRLSCGEALESRALLAGLSGAVPLPIPVGGVSDTAVVAPLALQAPPTAGPTANGPAGGMQVMPLVLWDSDGVTILPGVEQGNSGWQVVPAAQGGVQGAVDSPNPVEPWEPGGLLPEWEYRMYQEQGVLPPDARHTAEDPSVGSSDGDSEPWPLDPKTGHLRAFGPRVEGGDAKEAFGQVPGRVNGVLADVGGIVVAEGAPVLAGFWWFVTKGDDAVDLARNAIRSTDAGMGTTAVFMHRYREGVGLAGVHPALMIDGKVYVHHLHVAAQELAGTAPKASDLYGWVKLDAAGKVIWVNWVD